jgi:hypothetical protein
MSATGKAGASIKIKNVTHLQRNQSMHCPKHTLSFRSHPYLQLAHLNHGISKPTLKAGNTRNSLTSKTITQEPNFDCCRQLDSQWPRQRAAVQI